MVLLVACVVSLGGWVLVAPVVPKAGAALSEPPANLASLQLAAVRDAASVAAGRGSGVGARPVVAASGVAPSRAVDPKTRCGDDQAPVFADPEPDEDGAIRSWPALSKPAGVGYMGAQRRVDAALRSTGDPFDAAVADALNVGDLRSPDDRLAALVQDAATSGDPRVYALVLSACEGAGMVRAFGLTGGPPIAGEPGVRSCAALDPRRWAAHDPGNAAPWFYALERADAANDVAAQREALQQLGAAVRLHVGFADAAASVARLPPADDADLAGQSALAMGALPFELSPPFSGMTARCRDKAGADPTMLATCEHVAGVLFDHSDGLLPRSVGGAIHKLATGDATWLDGAHKDAKELGELWATSTLQEPPAGAPTCDFARHFMRHFVLVAKVGEREAMKQEIAALAAK